MQKRQAADPDNVVEDISVGSSISITTEEVVIEGNIFNALSSPTGCYIVKTMSIRLTRILTYTDSDFVG